jgi:hypothetical protein
MTEYTPPEYKSEGFNCPHCKFYAHQEWFSVEVEKRGRGSEEVENLEYSRCVKCNNYLLWVDGKIIYPAVSPAPPPHADMPEEVKKIYNEAKDIVSKSSRASAALLRTALIVLVDKVIGPNKNSLNHNIGTLVEQNKLSNQIQKSLDYLRVIGDNELHPGLIQMDEIDEDDYRHAISLFELVNLIVEELISRPDRINKYYSRLPTGQKEQIENRDKKADKP